LAHDVGAAPIRNLGLRPGDVPAISPPERLLLHLLVFRDKPGAVFRGFVGFALIDDGTCLY
jgi:hypothetical protein